MSEYTCPQNQYLSDGVRMQTGVPVQPAPVSNVQTYLAAHNFTTFIVAGLLSRW